MRSKHFIYQKKGSFYQYRFGSFDLRLTNDDWCLIYIGDETTLRDSYKIYTHDSLTSFDYDGVLSLFFLFIACSGIFGQ